MIRAPALQVRRNPGDIVIRHVAIHQQEEIHQRNPPQVRIAPHGEPQALHQLRFLIGAEQRDRLQQRIAAFFRRGMRGRAIAHPEQRFGLAPPALLSGRGIFRPAGGFPHGIGQAFEFLMPFPGRRGRQGGSDAAISRLQEPDQRCRVSQTQLHLGQQRFPILLAHRVADRFLMFPGLDRCPQDVGRVMLQRLYAREQVGIGPAAPGFALGRRHIPEQQRRKPDRPRVNPHIGFSIRRRLRPSRPEGCVVQLMENRLKQTIAGRIIERAGRIHERLAHAQPLG